LIDPITALSAASVCYTTLKKAVAVGKDVEEIYRTLSKWAGHIEDVKEVISQEKNKPGIFKTLTYKRSATQEVFDSIIAEEKIREQEKYIREFFTANWTADWGGLNGYRKFIKMRREIKKRREREVYNQMRRRKNFLYNTKMGVAVGSLVLLLIYLSHFLWTAIVEASK
jgi:hypothetical protein|tara:strand:+ start:1670 stop:2176 length:507 start_codon:yes stop_codon:yes gene_type:complete